MKKSALHRFAEEFRDTVFTYVRRSLSARGSDPSGWTAARLAEAATELAAFKREKILVNVVPGTRALTITTRSPRGAEVVPCEDLECVDVVFLALDELGVTSGKDYVQLTLAEGGISVIGEWVAGVSWRA